ncbi:hypothetical protein GLOIN_2v1874952 [Rhizophagus irregularis DAOM 181602=DAOM 197198]|uniref:Uncharacterized protein n=1 Tax=Rhizophagus irregularis (strain DAOM 181602 / DAOM 197198 / MUCL 43194) TaxID=747089 RepID=A0A2P4Q5F9_RHIID|nr:hypothetical protein GLOIN_2v1874952 [Rhizophagus irregularis DAOM 181602=DAOM 197198]POG72844.1 hypothetical protein GLOIN_2v1874952 [Rhizophagus irregularis DAOM 181602=DAOM 197198]|eukprot:XP_025179710.1 hypothetical protein GLOIN_2v1874952 [Rhizophagus irregularis DAOM 181602=DAOM 197198]
MGEAKKAIQFVIQNDDDELIQFIREYNIRREAQLIQAESIRQQKALTRRKMIANDNRVFHNTRGISKNRKLEDTNKIQLMIEELPCIEQIKRTLFSLYKERLCPMCKKKEEDFNHIWICEERRDPVNHITLDHIKNIDNIWILEA